MSYLLNVREFSPRALTKGSALGSRKETGVSLTFLRTFGVCHHCLGDIHRRWDGGPGATRLLVECRGEAFAGGSGAKPPISP